MIAALKKRALILGLLGSLCSASYAKTATTSNPTPANSVATKSSAEVPRNPVFDLIDDQQIAAFKAAISKGTDINTKNERGETLLMTAAALGQKKIVQFLLEKKANLNLKDNEEHPALFFAITNEQSNIAVTLIKAGASLDSINDENDSALAQAASVNDHAVMELAIKKNKSLVNKASKDGYTALMYAARFGDKKSAAILIKAGADKSVKNKNGKTALDFATKAQNDDVVKLLTAKK